MGFSSVTVGFAQRSSRENSWFGFPYGEKFNVWAEHWRIRSNTELI